MKPRLTTVCAVTWLHTAQTEPTGTLQSKSASALRNVPAPSTLTGTRTHANVNARKTYTARTSELWNITGASKTAAASACQLLRHAYKQTLLLDTGTLIPALVSASRRKSTGARTMASHWTHRSRCISTKMPANASTFKFHATRINSGINQRANARARSWAAPLDSTSTMSSALALVTTKCAPKTTTLTTTAAAASASSLRAPVQPWLP